VPTYPGTVAVLAAAVLAVTACTGDDGAPDPTADTGRSICATADGEGPRVGLAYDVGGRGDHGLDDGAYAGLVTAVEEKDATCVEAEARRDEPSADRADRLRKMAGEGRDPVVAVGSAYAEPAAEVAAEFPDTSFAVIGAEPGASAGPGNLAHLVFDDAEGSHLVGAAAAAQSEAGTLGVVGLVDVPPAVVAGFRAGARAQRDDVVVRVRLVDGPRALRPATRAMLRRGVDVVYDVSGLADSGVAAEVDAAGSGRAIGFGADLRSLVPPPQQDAVLTSMLRHADLALLAVVRAAAAGEQLTGTEVLGVAADGVGWSDSGELPDEVVAALEAAAERLVARGGRSRPGTAGNSSAANLGSERIRH
jgi:basic membrane protein A